MILSRRGFGISLGAVGATCALPGSALASTAIALSLETLVSRSDRVVTGTPVSHESEWVSVEGSRRIVTTTRFVQKSNWFADDEEEDELLIATLGGQIGDLHQKVAGEAELRLGEESVLFVSGEQRLLRRVIGMGQGHYPVDNDGELRRVRRSREMPHLVGDRPGAHAVPRKRRAVDVLHGASLEDARSLVRGAR